MKKSAKQPCARCGTKARINSDCGNCRDCIKKLVCIENKARAAARREEERRKFNGQG